jgi:hypothetical protein
LNNISSILPEVDVILFIDETKFSINNNDLEDAIFYFGIAVNKIEIGTIHRELQQILILHNYQGATFHSTSAFSEKRIRQRLMNDLVTLFTKYRLNCYCYKYLKSDLYEDTKILKTLDSDILNFGNQEFQALFYFIVNLNSYLIDPNNTQSKSKYVMYCDRNVYSQNETEAFTFPADGFVITRMTFSDKSLISLLALPDILGYLFRKAKISQDKALNNNVESSRLTINCFTSLLKLEEAGLFHLVNVDNESKVIRALFGL